LTGDEKQKVLEIIEVNKDMFAKSIDDIK